LHYIIRCLQPHASSPQYNCNFKCKELVLQKSKTLSKKNVRENQQLILISGKLVKFFTYLLLHIYIMICNRPILICSKHISEINYCKLFLLNEAWQGQNSMSIKNSFTKLAINFFYLIYYLRYLITKSLPLNYLVVYCLTNSNGFFRLRKF
jgi:hypothetical protein